VSNRDAVITEHYENAVRVAHRFARRFSSRLREHLTDLAPVFLIQTVDKYIAKQEPGDVRRYVEIGIWYRLRSELSNVLRSEHRGGYMVGQDVPHEDWISGGFMPSPERALDTARALSKLSARRREVLLRYELLGQGANDIATELGMARRTVYQNIELGRRAIDEVMYG
jgi:DNA-directed RNA polymerase specialized sigma24 family protein